MDVLYYNDGDYMVQPMPKCQIAHKYNINSYDFFNTIIYLPTTLKKKYILQLSENVIFSNQCHRNNKHSYTGHTRTITRKMFE